MKLTDNQFKIDLQRIITRSSLKELKRQFYLKKRDYGPYEWFDKVSKIMESIRL